MTVVRDAVADYLTIRRALGFKLVEHQRLLDDFATYLEQAGASTITTELAARMGGPLPTAPRDGRRRGCR